jgi:hypothetical protein
MRESLGPKANTSPTIWDHTGASISITPDLSDFHGTVTPLGEITQLKGIAKGYKLKAKAKSIGPFTISLATYKSSRSQRIMFPTSRFDSC